MPRTPRNDETSPNSVTREAIRLRDKWAVLAQAHIAIGGGCSCGAGATPVQVQDFEQDILDHLSRKHADAALQSYLRDARGSVSALLAALAEPAAGASDGGRQLLADLARSIESFDQLHSGH
jgi:hypothetical protein